MEYIVVYANELDELIQKVNEHLLEGWELSGTMSVVGWKWWNEREHEEDISYDFYQPMTISEERLPFRTKIP